MGLPERPEALGTMGSSTYSPPRMCKVSPARNNPFALAIVRQALETDVPLLASLPLGET